MIYLNDHIDKLDISEALRQVSPQRAAYALRYRRELDQRLSLAVFLLLQQALREEYGLKEVPEFAFGPNGKPYLKEHPEIHFNLSHCSRAAMCVVADHPVGCDIETVPDELDMELCRYCFTEEEVASILASDAPTLAFTTLWAQKEAFLKLAGTGLSDWGSRVTGWQSDPVTWLPGNSVTHSHVSADRSYVYTVCQ